MGEWSGGCKTSVIGGADGDDLEDEGSLAFDLEVDADRAMSLERFLCLQMKTMRL